MAYRIFFDGQEMTKFTEGLDQIEDLLIGLNEENRTVTFSVTNDFTFFGDAFTYIEERFMLDTSEFCDNAIQVVLQLDCCSKYEMDFQIRFDAVSAYAPTDCSVRAKLLAVDNANEGYRCLKSKIFWDWGTFKDDVETAAVAYCTNFTVLSVIFISIIIAFAPLLTIIQLIFNVLNAIPGVSISSPIPTVGDLLELVAGCTRYHPSPYLLDIFTRNCTRCGLTFSSSILEQAPYSDTVLLQAQYQKGTERDQRGNNWIDANGANLNTIQLAELLKDVFNSDYRITNDNEFRLERKDKFREDRTIIFDAEDMHKKSLASLPSYTRIPDKQKSYARLEWAVDAVDIQGNQELPRNNDLIEWNPNDSPCRSDEYTNIAQFGAVNGQDSPSSDDAVENLRQGRPLGIPLPLIPTYNDNILMTNGLAVQFKLLVIDPTTKSDDFQLVVHRELSNGEQEYNYPMFFREGDPEGLYEQFFKIDDPREGVAPNFTMDDLEVVYD